MGQEVEVNDMTSELIQRNLVVTRFFELEMPRCQIYMRAHARKYLRNEAVIDDILQTSWLKLYQRLTGPDSQGMEVFTKQEIHYAWMKKVIKHDALNYLKEQKRFKQLDPAEALAILEMRGREPSPEIALTYQETQEDLIFLLQEIPLKQRKVLYQHLYQGMSLEEIAQQSALSANTVRSWYMRGRKSLKQIVDRKITPADLLLLIEHSVMREK